MPEAKKYRQYPQAFFPASADYFMAGWNFLPDEGKKKRNDQKKTGPGTAFIRRKLRIKRIHTAHLSREAKDTSIGRSA